ncbi:MAG: radical SAM protein [Myxococcota bacterium]
MRSIARSAVDYLRPRLPNYLVFFITKRCNARCHFCFYPINQEEDELSLEEIAEIFDRYPHFQQVTLSGGEPYMRKGYSELVKILHQRGGVRFLTVSSNGSMPQQIGSQIDRILTDCPELHYRASLSVDHFPAEHEALREIEGLWERIRESYREMVRLKQKHPDTLLINVQTVISSFNKDRIGEIFELISHEFPLCRKTLVLVRGDAWKPEALDVSAEEYESAARLWAGASAAPGGGRGAPHALVLDAALSSNRELTLRTLRENREILPCQAGRKFLVLDSNGDVLPCEMKEITEAVIGGSVLGNVRDHGYDLKKLLAAPEVRERIDRIQARGCFCTYECATNANIVYNPRVLPGTLARHVLGRRSRASGPTGRRKSDESASD